MTSGRTLSPKASTTRRKTLSTGLIDPRIIVLRDQKVMLSSDLARLYVVKPKALV